MANLTYVDGLTSDLGKVGVGIRSQFRQDQYRNLTVSQSLPKYADLAIARKIYGANTGAGTGITAIVAVPTTTAQWALYNGGSGNTVLIVLKIYMWLISGVSGIGEAIMAGLSPTVQGSALTKYTNSVIHPLCPGAATTEAVFAQNATLAGAPVWDIVAEHASPDVSDSTGLIADVEGMYVIPAGFALGVDIYNIGGTAELYGVGFTWAELTLDRS